MWASRPRLARDGRGPPSHTFYFTGSYLAGPRQAPRAAVLQPESGHRGSVNQLHPRVVAGRQGKGFQATADAPALPEARGLRGSTPSGPRRGSPRNGRGPPRPPGSASRFAASPRPRPPGWSGARRSRNCARGPAVPGEPAARRADQRKRSGRGGRGSGEWRTRPARVESGRCCFAPQVARWRDCRAEAANPVHRQSPRGWTRA